MSEEVSTAVSLDIETKPVDESRTMKFTVSTSIATWRHRFYSAQFNWPTLLTYVWSTDWGTKLYINGSYYKSEYSKQTPLTTEADSNLILGQKDSSDTAYENFQIQDLSIWPRQLSSTEIKQGFEAGKGDEYK